MTGRRTRPRISRGDNVVLASSPELEGTVYGRARLSDRFHVIWEDGTESYEPATVLERVPGGREFLDMYEAEDARDGRDTTAPLDFS